MSGHLIGCAGALQYLPIDEHLPESERRVIPSSHKLALLAFSDSADDRTHIGFAGYEGVQRWAGCSRGRAAELIRDLVEWQLLKQHKRGHRGQRAEYVVFPLGCCEIHRTPVEEAVVDADVEQLAAAAGVSVDQARTLLAAMVGAKPEKGSGAPDAMSGTESDASDAIAAETPERAFEAVDNPGKGPERVHGSRSIADAFTPSERSTPYPAGEPAGSCAAHPNGHANCRDCGTSPRARREIEKRRRAAEARAAEQARVEAERQAAAASRVAAADRPELLAALRAEARGARPRTKELAR